MAANVASPRTTIPTVNMSASFRNLSPIDAPTATDESYGRPS